MNPLTATKAVAVVVDDYSLHAFPRLEHDLGQAGALVMRCFKGLPNPNLLRRFPQHQGVAVLGGADRAGLVVRLELATSTLKTPVVAVLPERVEPSAGLRGPGVVDLIPAGAAGAAERIVLMARVPIISLGHKEPPPARDRALGARSFAVSAPSSQARPPFAPGAPAEGKNPESLEVIGVASSTGGVWVLAKLLQDLPQDLGLAVLVAQHMSAEFVGSFCEWLSSVSGWRTIIVDQETPITPGAVFVAAGGLDLCVQGRNVMAGAPSSRHVPCADRLLKTLALSYGRRATGVVLSGMGSDGAQGLAEIVKGTGRGFCQQPSTAIIASMPESALKAAPAALALSPEALPAALIVGRTR